MNDNDILSLLCSSEREAARLILQAHDILAECKTNRRDVVTEYDRRVQELLIRRITETVPDARFSVRKTTGTTIWGPSMSSSSTPSTAR